MTRDVRVLVTGFGPFPGVPDNVSSEIAKACAASWSARTGITAEALTIATDWHTAPGVVREHIKRTQPHIIIHLGVSDLATAVTLETQAYNESDLRPDVSGNAPARTALCPGSPANQATSAPIAKIAKRLEESGQKVTISGDPGRYLCNAVYHETLLLCDGSESVQSCIFVHIPTHLSVETVTRTSLLQSLNIVLETMLPR